MKITEVIKNYEDAKNREIDCSKLWKITPMPTKHSNETLAGMFFLFGKAIYEEDDAIRDFKNNFLLAVRYFRSALMKGDRRAAFYLGELHYKGQGVLKNHVEAFKFYHESLRMDKREQLYGESLHRIGWCLDAAHGTEGDIHAANRFYKLSYEAGSAKGAEYYGWVLFHGRNVRKDTKKGLKIMLEAKEKGIKDVYLDLAYCYERGIEVERQSPTKAFELTKKAYEHEGLFASIELARYYGRGFGVEKNMDEAAQIYHDTYKKGGFERIVAQAHYGHCLIKGCGVERNFERGFKLLRGACIEKRSIGWTLLGDCYRHGNGLEQDYDMAVRLYNRAIIENIGVYALVRTHLSLGDMKEAGQGISGMKHDTFYYYKFAADRHNPVALWKLGQMFQKGKEVVADVQRAFEYFKLSARGGHLEAQNIAGGYIGDILERPRITAVAAIEEAAESGDQQARRMWRKISISKMLRFRRRNTK